MTLQANVLVSCPQGVPKADALVAYLNNANSNHILTVDISTYDLFSTVSFRYGEEYDQKLHSLFLVFSVTLYYALHLDQYRREKSGMEVDKFFSAIWKEVYVLTEGNFSARCP